MITDYRTLRDEINSFAILNCEHKRLFWRMIGHTAMVYRDPATGVIYVYESTQMSYSGVSGVQLHLLGEWLDHYPGKVFIRPLKFAGDAKSWTYQCEAMDRLQDHIWRYRGTSYPDLKTRQGRWFLIKAAWDSGLFKKASTNTDTDAAMFCTHLVAHAYRACRLIDTEETGWIDYNPAEFEPDDMRNGSIFERLIRPECVLQPEIRIK